MPINPDPIRIAYAEDHRMFRQAISSLFNADPRFRVIIEAMDGEEFIQKLQEAPALPDVALIDISMPRIGGFGVLKFLQEKEPQVKAIMLSAYDHKTNVEQAILEGASGYVVKDEEFNKLIDAVLQVQEYGSYFKSAAAQQFFKSRTNGKSLRPVLNQREREVLELICTDMGYEQMATYLNLSQKAIEFYRHRLFKIFDVKNRAGLMLIALSQGIISVNTAPPPQIIS